ncbi:MAG TPA: MATE family efflux transporter [Syntrophomonadaceae bacterium]|jgi:putative MATE family efflux protein|nr:MATE family efflux transporter [Syntrophomonadaceae bacterium]
MVIFSILSLVDTFFIAQLGSAALAALTLCIPIEILLVSCGTATGIGLASLIARMLGRGEVAAADNAAWHGLVISSIYGVFFAWVGLLCIDELLLLFGCSVELFSLSKEYLEVIFWGAIFIFISDIAESIVQGEGNTMLPTITALATISCNVLLDPILIFGWGTIPAMGMKGAALATILAEAAGVVFIFSIIWCRPSILSWSLAHFRPSLRILIAIYKVGLPSLVMECISVLVMIVLNKILIGFSYTAVAAMGVFMRIRAFFYMPVHGLAQGVMPIVGFAYGARNYDRVKETMMKASVLSFLMLLIGWYFMQYHSTWMLGFFAEDPALIMMGLNCMQLGCLALPLTGPIIILYTVLQAVGKGITAMWLSLIRQVLFLFPALFILPAFFQLNGVWLAISTADFLAALTALVIFIKLWLELTPRRSFTMLMLLRRDHFWARMKAWLRWSQ